MFSKSLLTGRTGSASPFAVSTVELRGLSAEFDRSVSALPASMAEPVRVPAATKGRADFLKQLAARSAARLAAGGTALVLVLLSAETAQAQSSDVSLNTLDGVKSVEVLEDGSASVTLENGAVMRLPAGSFTVAGGEVLVPEAVALQVTEAAAAGSGGSAGAIAAVGGGVAAAGLAAGGGGGGSDGGSDSGGSGAGGSGTSAPSLSGTVVDGYIVNATVFQDVNGNSVFDAGEPNTTTDALGNFNITLDSSNPAAKLVSVGGVDSSTGQAFTGTLTAPAGSSVITPLTTLVQSLVEASAGSDTPLTVDEANAQLADALGLSGQNLLELDPVEAIEDSGDAAAFAAAAQVASVISAAAATQDSDADSSAASEAAAASLAEQILAAADDPMEDPLEVLNDADAIQTALEEAGVDASEASGIASQVETANDLIDGASGTPEDIQNTIEAVQEVVQGDLVDAIEDDGTDVGSVDVADEAANIVPLRPEITTEVSGLVGPDSFAATIPLVGTGRPGSIVRVSIGGVEDTTTVDGSGNWLFNLDAGNFPSDSGTFDVQVSAAPSGSSVYTVPVSGGSAEVDLTPPAAPVIDPVSDDNALDLDEQQTALNVTGTAEAGADVAVTINGVTEDAVAGADGAFSVTFDAGDVPAAGFTISAVATDTLGNEGPAGTQAITLEPVSALTPTISPVSGTFGAAELAAGLTFSGTGRSGSTVTVTIDGAEQEATVDGDGNWSVTFAEADLPDATGDYTVSAVATLGGTSFSSGAVAGGGFSVDLDAPAAPTIDAIAGNDVLELEEQDADLTVTGTAEAGATVEVTIGSATESAVAGADGAYTVTFDAADVPDTDFSVDATATDPLGNEGPSASQAVTVEPVSTLTPVVDQVSGIFGPSELAAGLMVSGTGRAGSTVQVDVAGVVQDAAVDGDGNWSTTFAEDALPDATGDYTVTAVAVLDGTAFSSGEVAGGSFSVDLDAAAAPVFDTVAGNDVIELEERGSDLTVSGMTDAGATVDVTINGVTETVEADGTGAFSVTFAAADVPTTDFTINATATDDLGNTSATAMQAITLEPVSALTPTSSPVSGTFGAAELAAGLTVSGTGRSGSTVTVTIDGAEQEVTVDGDGNWSVNFAEVDLPDATGDYTVSAVATLNGTTFSSGAVSGGGFSVDLDAPIEPVVDLVAGDDVLDLEEQGVDLTVTGTAEAGATVDLTIGSVTESTVAGADGSYSVTFAAADVPDTDFLIEATATDPFGNESPSGSVAVTVEPVSALTPTINDTTATLGIADRAAGLDVSGTGRVGSTVTVTINGVALLAPVAADGQWNVTFTESDLPDVSGTYPVTADATLDGSSVTSGSVAGGDVTYDLQAPDAPTLDAVTGDDFLETAEQDADLTITGTAEANAVVTVTIGATSEQVTADGDGNFSATFDAAAVPGGDFSVSAVAEDAVGNQSTPADRAVTVQISGQSIIGDFGNNDLTGTAGDDYINPEGNDGEADGIDVVYGSAGNDEIDLSTSGGTSFVELNYAALDGPIDVTLDYANNTGTVDKGSDGTDTLTSPETTGEAFGIGLVGTQGDDTFTVIQDGDPTWAGIFYEGGDDTVNVTLDSGIVRVKAVSIDPADEDVTANLNTGDITFASGSIDLNVTGTGGRIELETGDGNDSVTGSARDERFILGAGTDTLDAGGGFDEVRYDRGAVVDGVEVNLETGQATGTWSGQAFTHNLSNVEMVRGSRTGDDIMTAADSGSTLDGRGGDDLLIGGAGDDTLIGGDGEDIFFVGQGNDVIRDYEGDIVDTIELDPAYTEAEIDAAIAAAVQDGDDVVVTFASTGATLRLEGWTVADLQAENASGGSDIVGTPDPDNLVGTDGDDTIDPQGNDGNDPDVVVGSLGDDTIDLSNTGGESFVVLDYEGLSGPIDVTLNYALNQGQIVKGVGGADGTDTLINPNTTGEANGIDIFGTSGDDTFTIVQNGAEAWAAAYYRGGNDTINLTLDTGIVRITTSDDENVTANLSTGDITFASGSIDLNVTGTGGRIELVTGSGDDNVTGSALDERFSLGAGTDTLDAGDGFDLVRYDRFAVSQGVNVNLETGIATGMWDGQSFTHNLFNVEYVRGSRTGGDTLTAADSGSRLEGRGGNDTLIGGAGDDLLVGGDGEDTFIVGRGNDVIRDYEGDDVDTIELDPAYTEAEIDAAIAAAVQDGDDVVVTFVSTGATLRLEGWTVADLQAENASAGSDIIGVFGDDTLDGTAGDDYIDPMGNDDGFDLVNASAGNDEIDLSNSGGTSYVELDYSALAGPIIATVDYASNTGSVDKGADGVDTLTSPATVGEAFGLGLQGTAGDDTFNITQGSGDSWIGVFYQGGNDTINANMDNGIIRIGTSGEDVTANLVTGDITFASGSIDLNVTGTGGRIDLQTYDGNDNVTGSDRDERFILGAGTDTLDAGGGFDTVRYDRSGIDTGVTVNLGTNTATGTWNGQAFTHTLLNVEGVRGSRSGDDMLTASDLGSQLDGRGGDDTLTGGDGADVLIGGADNDTLEGGAGEDLFIVGQGDDIIRDFEAGIDEIQLDSSVTDDEVATAVDNAQQVGDDVLVTLPDGATVLFEDWLVADLQQEYADRFAVTNVIGTDGDDVLDGTDGNDYIDPQGNNDGEDIINASTGDDAIDLSASGGESYVELRYGALSGPIEATIDYANDFGSVNKFGDGFDDILNPLSPGEALGLGIDGTVGDDVYNIVQGDTFSWTGVYYEGGNDTINATLNDGIIRVDTSDDAVTANLTTGDITFNGGSIDLNVTGSGGRIELRTFDADDNVTGSDRDERFILGAGNDVLDAGGGHDVVRYDRGDVTDGVTVDLDLGQATGTWDGQSFTHSLSGVEEVYGSRSGNDTLIAASTGSVFVGRGGDDSYTGGAGEDIFVVGEGHDTIFDFDIDLDQLQTRDGAFESGLPDYEDVTSNGEPSLRFNFGADDSVTLVGVTSQDLENTIASENLSLSPGSMNNPVTIEVNGTSNQVADMVTAFQSGSMTQSSSEVVYTSGNITLSLAGSGLSVTGGPDYAGSVDTMTLTLDGSPVFTATDIGAPLSDIADMLDDAALLGSQEIDLGTGFGNLRDVIVVGDDAAQDIFYTDVDQWIETGAGDDTITFDRWGTGIAISGDGNDTINILNDTGGTDQVFIYIDADDTGTDVIDGFRFTDSEGTGDRIVVQDDRGAFSIAWEVDDAGDQSDLDAIAATFDSIGSGEYALFYDQGGNAVLQDLIEGGAPGANYTLGDTIATFTNADVSQFSGSSIDSFLKYSDIDLPPASELV
ncbi:hypothetical protein RA27_17895 [Ruegeria sp. ANG-R]|uniref:Ig-like domain-containing protein n=1 Tax=Ruegeria sp. ANG-R TaxID=1577903 RepID=UPI00057F1B14|nr:Ig-like domain-containing protein [Ruegeria sp. ANG-R]KIC39029.1 hypothetical protein RA27_17895 [Ruegeria sp. ANG-R]